MDHPPESLKFEDDDMQLFTVEPLSAQMRVSRAFVRLCMVAGCPSRGGKLSAAEVLHWLFDNYEPVRALAGFAALAPVEDLAPVVAKRLRMANALHTLVDFSESRASDPEQKTALKDLGRTIERALERG